MAKERDVSAVLVPMPHSLLSDFRSQATFLASCAVLLALGGFVFGQRGGDEVISLPFAVDDVATEEVPVESTMTAAPEILSSLTGPEFSISAVPSVSDVQTITVSGTASPGTQMFSLAGPAVHSAEGDWSIPIVLALGPNEVLIEGLGENGEIASETVFVQFEPGDLPEVAFSAEQQFRASQDVEPWEFFSGTATPLSTVVVQSGFGTATAVADETGAWSTAVFFDAPGGNEPFDVVVEAVNGSATFDFLYMPAS